MSDHREFHEVKCFYCKGSASWLVYEYRHDANSDFMFACDAHKYTCYS